MLLVGPGSFSNVRARDRWGICIVVIMMAVTALLVVTGLDNQAFWDDEANTAIYARNLLATGTFTAWDGHNLLGYAAGGSIGADLGPELRVPILPSCLVALGFMLFGETTFAARIPFALMGVASVAAIAFWARRHLGRRFPWWLPSVLLGISPAMLLYARNCRYYILSILLTTLLLALWAPGRARYDPRRYTVRIVAAVIVTILLILTHYLNAAIALAILPVLILSERRYRSRPQWGLLAWIYGAAFVMGVILLIVANPFAAEYGVRGDWLTGTPRAAGLFERFLSHVVLLFRDVSTHEFFAWTLVPVLVLSWSASRWRWPRSLASKLRPGQTQGWRVLMVVAMIVLYLVAAAAGTPGDMGTGEWAEARYIVPTVAMGALAAAGAIVVLWRLSRAASVVLFALLALTNWLYLPGIAPHHPKNPPNWPPTIVKYLREITHDSTTGTERMIQVLGQLPRETTVRAFPEYLVYPPMFYLPGHRYCDQLRVSKEVLPRKRVQMPDYVYADRVAPDVVIVPTGNLGHAIGRLEEKFGRGRYALGRTIREDLSYLQKPEIPLRVFAPDDEPTKEEPPGGAFLVRVDAPVAKLPLFQPENQSFEDLLQQGQLLRAGGRIAMARKRFEFAIAKRPTSAPAQFGLGESLLMEGLPVAAVEPLRRATELDLRKVEFVISLAAALEGAHARDEAVVEYRRAIEMAPDNSRAHYNLANLLAEMERYEESEKHYREAIRCQPDHTWAHVNLGRLLIRRGAYREAIDLLNRAISLDPRSAIGRLHLAEVYMLLDRPKDALPLLEESLRLIPSHSTDPRDQELGARIRQRHSRCRNLILTGG